MLTCEKCGAKGFIAVEGDEFHCLRCGLVWYVRKRESRRGRIGAGRGGGPAYSGGMALPRRDVHGQE
jgi:hypothetical protein